MAYLIGSIEIINGKNYFFVDYHHINKNPNKSLWTISLLDEGVLFDKSFLTNSISYNHSIPYSYYFGDLNGELVPIGVSPKKSSCYLCIFESSLSASTLIWHGYPVDHMEQNRVPSTCIKNWTNYGLDKKYVRKFLKGQRI